MYSEKLETMIMSVIADGKITDKERSVLHKLAEAEGVDTDELDVYLDGLLWELQQEAKELDNIFDSAEKTPNQAFSSVNTDTPEEKLSHYEKLVSQLKELDEKYQERLEIALKKGLSKHLGFSESEHEVYDELITRKYSTIIDYPLPTTEAEMLDFLTEVKAKSDISGPKGGHTQKSRLGNFGFAYWTLFEKGVELSQMKYTDTNFTPLYEYYKKEIEKSKKWWFGISRFFKNNTNK